jgi:hypothetical protein
MTAATFLTVECGNYTNPAQKTREAKPAASGNHRGPAFAERILTTTPCGRMGLDRKRLVGGVKPGAARRFDLVSGPVEQSCMDEQLTANPAANAGRSTLADGQPAGSESRPNLAHLTPDQIEILNHLDRWLNDQYQLGRTHAPAANQPVDLAV